MSFKLSILRMLSGNKVATRNVVTAKTDKQLNITLSDGRTLRLVFDDHGHGPEVTIKTEKGFKLGVSRGTVLSAFDAPSIEVTVLEDKAGGQ